MKKMLASEIVILLMLLLLQPAWSQAQPQCSRAMTWRVIRLSDERLQKLFDCVRHGNRKAASVLAVHLKELDGGNSEDALIALGEYSEHDMASYMRLYTTGAITSAQFEDALTAIDVGDEASSQLAALEIRKALIERVENAKFLPAKKRALRAIDDFEQEIQAQQGGQKGGNK